MFRHVEKWIRLGLLIAISYVIIRPFISWGEVREMFAYFLIWVFVVSSICAVMANLHYGKLSDSVEMQLDKYSWLAQKIIKRYFMSSLTNRERKVIFYSMLFLLIYIDIKITFFPSEPPRHAPLWVYLALVYCAVTFSILSWATIRGCKGWMAVELPWIKKIFVFVMTFMAGIGLLASVLLFLEGDTEGGWLFLFVSFVFFAPLVQFILYVKNGLIARGGRYAK